MANAEVKKKLLGVFAGWDGSGLACHKESRTGMMIISTSLNYHCMQS
jgi:hypothetical protein